MKWVGNSAGNRSFQYLNNGAKIQFIPFEYHPTSKISMYLQVFCPWEIRSIINYTEKHNTITSIITRMFVFVKDTKLKLEFLKPGYSSTSITHLLHNVDLKK